MAADSQMHYFGSSSGNILNDQDSIPHSNFSPSMITPLQRAIRGSASNSNIKVNGDEMLEQIRTLMLSGGESDDERTRTVNNIVDHVCLIGGALKTLTRQVLDEIDQGKNLEENSRKWKLRLS